MRYWLMKSEPSEYSIDDLQRDDVSSWFGVRNYQARNFMRDSMSVGDKVLFYHSNCLIPGIVGIAEIVGESHADETQFDPTSEYYDPKSSYENPRWICRYVRFVKKFPNIVSLVTIRSTAELSGLKILRKWNRLSITEVTQEEYGFILKLSGEKYDMSENFTRLSMKS